MRASNECVECCWLIPTFCISIFVLVFGSLLIAQVTDPANEFFVNDIYAAPGHRYADIWADSEQVRGAARGGLGCGRTSKCESF